VKTSQRTQTRNLKALCLILVLMSAALTGCLTQTRILYARATKLPAEVKGFMRLAQDSVRVNVIGDEKVGDFTTANAAAYILIHEQDVRAFVRAQQRLAKILAHPDCPASLKALK